MTRQPVGEPVPGWTPRPMPQGRLVGRFVTVEPMTDAHLDALFEATCGPDDDARWTYLPTGPHRRVEDLRAALVDIRTRDDARCYVLTTDGAVHGMAAYLRATPAAGTIEVGHILYGARLARTAAATEAMYLMARHVFDLGYRRYEWKCDSRNEPSRRAALRLGFGYEGRFRKATVTKGRNRDTDWFAMTDDDWARARPAYERWLHGIGADGRQREPLAAAAAVAQFRCAPPPVSDVDPPRPRWQHGLTPSEEAP